jgi:hypothetical protein
MLDDHANSSLNASQPGGEEPLSYVKEAAKLQYNLIGLAGAALFSLISSSILPLVLAAGLELIYLSVVPNMGRFQRLVRSWKYQEQKQRRAVKLGSLLQALPVPQRTRYAGLQSLCEIIRGNYGQLSSTSQMFVIQMEERLDGLLQAYLRLLSAGQQHRDLLKNTDSAQIKRALSQLQSELDSQPPKVQDINRKRIEILTKWFEKSGKLQENLKVIEAQCAAIEDVLQLIRTQSVSLRDPQQVNEQLGGLMSDVEQTEQTVQEVEAIFAMANPNEFDHTLSIAMPADTPSGNRNPIRS